MVAGTWAARAPRARAISTVAVLAGAMLVLWAAFIAAMVLTLVVTSDQRIEGRLREAIENGTITPANYRMSPFGDYYHSYDIFTECVGLGVNFSNDDERLIYRVAATPMVVDPAPDPNSFEPCKYLIDAIASGEPKAEVSYLRYWHGYLAYMRPMLMVFSLENVHRVTAVIFFGLLIYFAHASARWFGPWAWPAILAPPFLIGDFFTVPIVVTHAVHLSWIVLSVIVVMALLDRRSRLHPLVLPVVVLAAGAVTNFLSFLLNPPLAPALIAFLVIAARLREGAPRRVVPLLAEAGAYVALWFAGYVGAWVEKWLFAAMVLGPDAVQAEIAEASTLYTPEQIRQVFGDTLFFLKPTWLILSQTAVQSPHPKLLPFVILTWAVAAAIIVRAALLRRLSKKDYVDFALMVSPLLVVIAWIEAASFHSVIHVGYTYRSFLLLSILPVLAALLLSRRAASAGRPTAA